MTKKRKMDNAVAISFIQQAFGQYLSKVANKECKEAFAIAIKALEREEGCKNLNPYEDCDVFACSACGFTSNRKHKHNYCPNCGRRVEK